MVQIPLHSSVSPQLSLTICQMKPTAVRVKRPKCYAKSLYARVIQIYFRIVKTFAKRLFQLEATLHGTESDTWLNSFCPSLTLGPQCVIVWLMHISRSTVKSLPLHLGRLEMIMKRPCLRSVLYWLQIRLNQLHWPSGNCIYYQVSLLSLLNFIKSCKELDSKGWELNLCYGIMESRMNIDINTCGVKVVWKTDEVREIHVKPQSSTC